MNATLYQTMTLGACILLSAPAVRAQQWTPLGPAPTTGYQGATGRVSAVLCHPTDANLYYAAGADGGVWRTTDGGQSWKPLTDDMPTLSIGALAMDPTDPTIVYAGTGEAVFANHSRYGLGLYKSTDGGDTWQHLAESTFAGRCFSTIAVHPQNTGVLYAAITQAGGFPERAAAKDHPGATGRRGVFRSADGGHTWSPLPGVPDLCITDLVIDPANPNIVYAAAGYIFGDERNGIYKTTDGGQNWVKLTSGLPAETFGRISIAIAPSQPSRLYALITRPASPSGGEASARGAYRSDDGGQSWTRIGNGPNQSSYGWYLSVVHVHPAQPGAVFMGGLSLVRSTTGGGQWSNITPPHVDQHAMAFDAAGRLIAGCDGGVYRSNDLGATWESLNAGLGTIQFYAGLSTSPVDTEITLGGTQDNGTNLRGSASLAWNHILGGDGGWTQIDPSTPQRLFAEWQGTGNISRSTNGGQSFSSIGSGLSGRNCFLPPYLIDPANPQRMLYSTERVFLSTTGGGSWQPISPDLTAGPPAAIRSLAIAPGDSSIVYAATNDGRFLNSTDGGQSFTLRLEDLRGWPRVMREIFVDPRAPATVYLAGSNFGEPPARPARLRRSRDHGQTWERLDEHLPAFPVNVVAVDTRWQLPVIFAGTDSGLYRSRDDGRTWRRYGEGLPNACIVDIELDLVRQRLVLGTQGRGAWRAPLVFCYADVDDNDAVNIDDFITFINLYAAEDPRANCDMSTTQPALNIDDFMCFINEAAAGCP